jgi:multisubunit Na+/H+ antiporter MnhB subunit
MTLGDLAKWALLVFLAGSVLYILATYVRRRRHIRPAPLDPHIAIATGRAVWAPTPRPPWADEAAAEEDEDG